MTRQSVRTEAKSVLKNVRRYSIRSISLLNIEVREGIENIIIKNFNDRHE